MLVIVLDVGVPVGLVHDRVGGVHRGRRAVGGPVEGHLRQRAVGVQLVEHAVDHEGAGAGAPAGPVGDVGGGAGGGAGEAAALLQLRWRRSRPCRGRSGSELLCSCGSLVPLASGRYGDAGVVGVAGRVTEQLGVGADVEAVAGREHVLDADAAGAGRVPRVGHAVDGVQRGDALTADRTLAGGVAGRRVVLPAHVATGVDDVVGDLDGPGGVTTGVRRPGRRRRSSGARCSRSGPRRHSRWCRCCSPEPP